MTNDLEAIRQRDKRGFSEEGRTWDTKRITDTPAQMASDRHALLRYIDELRAAPEPTGDDEPVEYEIEDAIRIAGLWRAGKMIGGDEDGIRNALLAEVERLRALNRGAGT
jgi:hypothetical protein